MIAKEFIELEERDQDGYWIYLRRGFCDMGNLQCHTIVEPTKREAHAHDVEPCHCKECTDPKSAWFNGRMVK
jgi:hypothetical protein